MSHSDPKLCTFVLSTWAPSGLFTHPELRNNCWLELTGTSEDRGTIDQGQSRQPVLHVPGLASARLACTALLAEVQGMWPEPGSSPAKKTLFLRHMHGRLGACTQWCPVPYTCLLSCFQGGGGWVPEGETVPGR